MAEANWKDPELTPEEKIAGLILAGHNETPPVDVRRIAAEYARIEETRSPSLAMPSPSAIRKGPSVRCSCSTPA